VHSSEKPQQSHFANSTSEAEEIGFASLITAAAILSKK
jgi:hypothetical protein